MGIIYKLDFASGKSYIGLTTRTLEKRITQHRRDMKSTKRSFLVHAAWIKHGDPVISVIAKADGEELKLAEQRLIREFNTISPNGYNLSIGGDVPLWSEETRAKMGAAHRGKPKSEEHRARISAGLKGKEKSEAACDKMREAQKLRDPATRHDLSDHWTGKSQSAEHKEKKVAARRGVPRTAEVKAKISATKRANRFDYPRD